MSYNPRVATTATASTFTTTASTSSTANVHVVQYNLRQQYVQVHTLTVSTVVGGLLDE